MAEEPSTPDVQRFSKEEYDVTCCCEVIFCGRTQLTLGEEDAELDSKCCFGTCTDNKRGPYGELGTVDSSECCCFYGFRAGSIMPQPDQMQCIGWGCEKEMVDKIVADLKKRQGLRGDRAKTRMAESTLSSLALLHKKVDAIMESLELPPMSAEMER